MGPGSTKGGVWRTRATTAIVATLALVASTFVVQATSTEDSASAAPQLTTSSLVVNLDGNNTSSLAATSPSTWTSIAPGSSSASGSFTGSTARFDSDGVAGVSTSSTGSAVSFPAGTGAIAGAQTVEAWVNPAALNANWNIIASRWFSNNTGGAASPQDWHFAIYNYGTVAKLRLDTPTNNPGGGLSSVFEFSRTGANKWYRVGFTIDVSGNAQLYVNGEKTGASAAAGLPAGSANALLLVGDPRANTAMPGKISKLRIYSGALTEAQMRSNFLAESGLYGYPVVTFDSNGAGAAETYQQFEKGVAGNLGANNFNRFGYSFAGWSSTADGSGTSYGNSQAVTLTADLTLYAQWTLLVPVNTAVPTVAGTARVGQSLSASSGTWTSGTTPTLSWQWQRSADGVNWSNIPGATSASYTLSDDDGGHRIRVQETASNSAGSASALSTASDFVISTSNVTSPSGTPADIGTMFRVPSGSTVYNVTLVSSNLDGRFSLSSTSGLSLIPGVTSTAGYMPTTISGSGSIFSFRGTGTDINTALASLKYQSNSVQTDSLRMHYAVGSTTATDIRNYFPMYDASRDAANRLTFHYYASVSVTRNASGQNNAQVAREWLDAARTITSGGTSITSPNPWQLLSARSSTEFDRAVALAEICGLHCWAYIGGSAAANSSSWTFPAGNDGYSTATTFSPSPWFGGSANEPTTVVRDLQFRHDGSGWRFDDTQRVDTQNYWLSETWASAPVSATTSAQTFRTVTAPGAPTGLTVTPQSTTSYALSWAAPAVVGTDSITEYRVQYSTDNVNWTTFNRTASTALTATVTGLSAGTGYWFRVAAFTSVLGAYSTAISGAQADVGSTVGLGGFALPSTTTTGTIRVLLFSSNPAGKLSFRSTTNIDGGIRNTANYAEPLVSSNPATPINGYNPAHLGSAGRMIGLVDTSATDINAALATLQYSSSSASSDTITMWVSNGTEYIPIVNGSNVEFHYYDDVASSRAWDSARTAATTAQTIDGESTSNVFLATPRFRAENHYLKSFGALQYWLNATDEVENTWIWRGADANNLQFWQGKNTGAAVNSEYNDWHGSSESTRTEPNGDAEDCLGMFNGGGTFNNSGALGWGWNDYGCTTSLPGYFWEAFKTGAPFGTNTSSIASGNYASTLASRTVTVGTPVAAPTALTASSTTSGQVDLSWTAPAGVTGITSYSVQYSVDGATWTEARSTASMTTTQSIAGLVTGTYYHFRVAAIVGTNTGLFASTYFTPNGSGRLATVQSTATTVSGLQLESALSSRQVRVVVRATNSSAVLQSTSYASLTGVRGTANYTATAGAAALGTSGQMLGFVGTGSQVNTALANLKYTGPGSPGTDTISLWVSAGTSSTLPQEFMVSVNSRGEVEFRYFGKSASSFTWQGAINAAPADTTTINGQPALGKYVATPTDVDQNALVAAAVGSGAHWLNGGDYTTVSSSNSEGDWFWLGPDTGTIQFYAGSNTAGTGGIRNSQFVAWAATSSTVQAEPNTGLQQNCLATRSGTTHALSTGGFRSIAEVGGIAWDDNTCSSTTTYAWEYVASAPVGSSTLGDNYAGETARAVLINPSAEAPVGVTVRSAGAGAVALAWGEPTVYASTPITGYQVQYSTTADFASRTLVNVTSQNAVVTGLTAGTTYYFRVYAVGSGWSSLVSQTVTLSPSATTTSINVVASGGGVAGSDYAVNNGALTPLAGSTVSINAGELETLLATGDVQIAADSVTISAPIEWSTSRKLTLGLKADSVVAVNAVITASGVSAAMDIEATSYSLSTRTGARIELSGATPAFQLGATTFTVVNTEAGFATVATGTNWVLGMPLRLSTSPNAPINLTFTGTFDGLGNTVSNLRLGHVTSREYYGFFTQLNGATIRNFGVSELSFSFALAGNTVAGAIAGQSTGTTKLSQVWSSGSISATSSTAYNIGFGGLVGRAQAGSIDISRSWSSVSINTSAAKSNAQVVGGILGGTMSAFAQDSSSPGANVTITEVYSTGSIKTSSSGWRGFGGIVGLRWNTGTLSLTDVFSWGAVQTADSINFAGIVGSASGGTTTITRAYTSSSSCVYLGGTWTNNGCYTGQAPGSTVASISNANWSGTGATVLANVASPLLPLYVIPTAPTDGSVATVGFRIVDGNGDTYSASNLTVSGTPSWDTISASSAASTTPYAVTYVSGLTLGGSAASGYSLSAWPSATSITISKQPQTVTWSPTTSIAFGSGTATPSSLATASTTVSYAVTSAGTSGCTVNSSTAVLSYTAAGTCTVTATAANSGNFLSATASVSFSIASPAPAPTGVRVTGAGQTTAYVGWQAPMVSASSGITKYTVRYSTNADMSGAQSVQTESPRTWIALSGLTASTTYFVTVTANGAAWTGTTSTVASGVTRASASSITVVASGGVAAGTGYVSDGGAFVATGESVTINAAEIEAALANGDVVLGADNVTVNAPLAWASNAKLTLGNATTSTVAVNADLTATGNSAGLELAGSTYALDTKNGANVTLSGSSSTLSIGSQAFTLIRSAAGLSSFAMTGRFALAAPLTLTTNYSSSPVNLTFAGTFDGLGNTVNNLTITPTSDSGDVGGYGFFSALGGATIRNLGFTNVSINSSTAGIRMRLGAVAGNGSASGANRLSQVWATGFINQTATTGSVEAGGLVGGATGGSLDITRSWSSVSISTSATTAIASGGIIGTNVASWSGAGGTGNTLTVSESYSVGNILRNGTGSWYGNGGIIGVAYGASQTFTNVFSWGNVNSDNGVSTAGIVGVGFSAATTKINGAYTTNVRCAPTTGVEINNCTPGVSAGSSVAGFTTGVWSTAGGSSIASLPAPTKLLYVQVVAPSDGSFAGMSYRIVDSTGTAQTVSALGVTISGTPTYTIDASSARGTYPVSYVSGLTLGGANASVYSLSAWISTTSVTISRLPQSITWTPTTSLVRTDTGLTLPAATTSGDGAISYSVTTGTANCSINSSTRVLSFSANGSCVVTVTAAQTMSFTAATLSQTFIVSTAPPLPPTGLTVNAGAADGALTVNWTAPSVVTTGGTIASYTLQYSTNGSDWLTASSAISASATSFSITGLTNGLSYSIRLRAVNTEDTNGAWSTVTTGTPYWLPTNTAVPVISGSPVAALQLTTTDGSWSTNGRDLTATSYQWQRSVAGGAFEDISGATGSAYTPTSTDVGATLRVLVRVANGADSGATVTAESAATAVVQSGLASAPTLDSVTRGNQQIVVNWTAPSTTNGGTISSYTVQYSSNGSTWTSASTTVPAIATGYTLTGLSNGTSYFVRVWAVTAAGAGATAQSSIAVVPATVPSNSVVPTVTGTAAVAVVLAAEAGSWADNGDAVTGYSYQWQSSATVDGSYSDISGATLATYTPISADLGRFLRVVVTATNTVGSTSVASLATAAVLSGRAAAPSELTALAGKNQLTVSWTAPAQLNGGTITSYHLEYRASGSSDWLSPAVGPGLATTLTLSTEVSAGVAYEFRVTAVTAAGDGATATRTSNSDSTPFDAPTNSVIPSLGGVVARGNSLVASVGSWIENGRALSYSYQWEFQNAGDANWNAISGATGSTFTPDATMPGRLLRVVVTATNEGGSLTVASLATDVVQSARADAPGALTVVRGDSQLAVSWTKPSANGGTLSGYTVEYSSGGDTWSTASSTIPAAASSYTITGLTNGTSYSVRVRAATTAVSEGEFATSESTATPATLPSNSVAPVIGGTPAVAVVLTAGAGSWADNGEAITGYSYQWQSASTAEGSYSDISEATAASYTPSSSDLGRFLKVVVTASNAVGSTSVSSIASAVVDTGLAEAPTSLEVAFASSPTLRLNLSWIAPTELNGGSVITGYVVEYRAQGAADWTVADSSVTGTSVSVTGLNAGTNYDVRVAAITAAGTGLYATSSEVTLFGGAPKVATSPQVSGFVAEGETVSVSQGDWTDFGVSITGYSYRWQRSADGNSAWLDISGANAASYTLTSADTGNFVRAVVTATNSVGSTDAAVLVGEVDSGVASAPQAVTAIPGDREISVSWQTPSDSNGGLIRGYRVELDDGGGWEVAGDNLSASTFSLVLTGLQNGIAYQVRVRAVTTLDGLPGSPSDSIVPFGLPISLSAPSLSGALGVGETLAASIGAWESNGRSITATRYQWQRSTDAGESWTNLGAETDSSYVLTSNDLGYLVRVVITRTNEAGETSAASPDSGLVLSGVAKAPTGLVVTRGDGALRLDWTAPSETDGGIIRGYLVEYRETFTSTWSALSQTNAVASTATVTGLTNGTSYDVRVSAVTAQTGTPTSFQSVIPAGLPIVQTVPRLSGTLAEGYALSATVGSFAVNDAGELTHEYRWQVSIDGQTGWSDIPGATLTGFTLTAVEVGQFVRFAHRASNSVGDSWAYSDATAVIQSGVTAAPLGVSAAVMDQSVTLSWGALIGSALNGAVLAGYRAQISTDGQSWTSVDTSGTSSSFSGLVNGTTYYLRVAGYSSIGATGTFASAVTAVPFGAPLNTALPTVGGTEARGYTLSGTGGIWNWNGRAAEPNGFQWQRSTDGETWSDIAGANSADYLVTVEDVNARLRLAVTASNSGELSSVAYSAPSSTIGSAIAAAPTGLEVTPGDSTLSLAWVAPTELNGGIIVDYLVRISTDNTSFTTVSRSASTTTSQLISGLTNGQQYWLSVAAVTTVTGTALNSASSEQPFGVPINTVAPGISGLARVGDTLTATLGGWDSNGRNISATDYQWQRSSDGETWTDIPGAIGVTFVPGDELGDVIRVAITRTNLAGSTLALSAASTTVTIGTPGPPSAIRFTPGDLSATVSWTAPTWLAGGAISDYSVEVSVNGGAFSPVERTASPRASQSITDLSLGSRYVVRVRAESGESSAWLTSEAFTAIGKPVISVAPVVTGMTLAGETLRSTLGSWDERGSTLTGTTVQWQESIDNGASWSNVAGANSTSVQALAGRVYRTAVTATNAAGSTLSVSEATPFVVSEAPSEPRELTVTPADRSLILNWSAPTSLGGGQISDYQVFISTDGDSWTRVERSPSAATSQTISGLTNGTGYYLRLKAVTTVEGSWTFSNATKPFGAPMYSGSLSLVSGTAAFARSLNSSAGTWDFNGRGSAGVAFQWQRSADGQTWSDISGATASTLTLNGFVGEQIRVKLTASNAGGLSTSVFSTPTSAVVEIKPDAPGPLSVVPGDAQLRVSWAAPASLGGKPLERYIVEYSEDGDSWTRVPRTDLLATSETILGLKNGTEYLVRVATQTTLESLPRLGTASFIPFGLPINLTQPSITGTPTFDATMNASTGDWSDNGRSLSVAYQWQVQTDDGWTNIAGATNSSYTIGDLVGASVRVAIIARNEAGATTAYAEPSASVAPAPASGVRNLTVAAADQAMQLEWQAPEYLGGAPISNYLVEYATDGGSWQSVSRPVSATPSQTITGLSNGTGYQVRVRAFNGVTGNAVIYASLIVPRGTPIAGDLPTIALHSPSAIAPQVGLELTGTQGTWLTNGAEITDYRYQWQVGDGSNWVDVAGATTERFTPTGNVGSQIRVVVTARNAAGGSQSVSATTAAILPAPASAPRSVTVTEADSGFTLSWLAPTSTGGAAVVDYRVEISTDGDDWTRVDRIPSAELSQSVSGLTNGTSYYARVRALNGVNGSIAFVSEIIPRGVPLMEIPPTVTGIARYGTILTATEGGWAENGAAITGTSFQWQASRDGVVWTNISGATQSNYLVGNVVGQQLRVQVQKLNEAGPNVSSSAATAPAEAIAAVAPSLASQQVGNAQLSVNWSQPIHGGGLELTGYTLQYSSDLANWTTVRLPASVRAATLTGLTNGVGYFVRVRAETDRAGDWSSTIGPLTPIAPPVPLATPSQPTPTPSLLPSLLNEIMPIAPTTSSITSLTGASAVTITADGRIELQPNQSVALRNGEPIAADVSRSGNNIVMQTETVTLELTLAPSSMGPSASANPQLTQGVATTFSGDGFARSTPVVTWIQSTPTKLSEAMTDGNGNIEDSFEIPSSIEPGPHTIQINGMDNEGNVVSIIYGVEVTAFDASSAGFGPVPAEATPQPLLWLGFLLLAVLIVLTAVELLRRRLRGERV